MKCITIVMIQLLFVQLLWGQTDHCFKYSRFDIGNSGFSVLLPFKPDSVHTTLIEDGTLLEGVFPQCGQVRFGAVGIKFKKQLKSKKEIDQRLEFIIEYTKLLENIYENTSVQFHYNHPTDKSLRGAQVVYNDKIDSWVIRAYANKKYAVVMYITLPITIEKDVSRKQKDDFLYSIVFPD